MEEQSLQIGSTEYVVGRHFVGQRNAKELVLDRILAQQSPAPLDNPLPSMLLL